MRLVDRRFRALLALGILAPALMSCSGDEDGGGGGESANPTTTAEASVSSTTASDPDSTATSTTGEPAGSEKCTDNLMLVNAAAEEGIGEDRAIEPVSVLADQGPHPANTVDYDSSLSIAISETEIVADEQFGLGIPIGAPDNLAEDALYLSLSFFNEKGAVEVGQVYVDQLDYDAATDDGKINSTLLNFGSKRLLPGSFEVTLTEITDERVCGEITTVTRTDLQTFVGVEGTFVADRIQALEAESESGA